MTWQTIQLRENECTLRIIFNRLEQLNSINTRLLQEINEVLDMAERNPRCRIVILEGQADFFCSGMDFHEVALSQVKSHIKAWTELYMTTLKRLTGSSKVTVCKIEGEAIAGGMGFVAACDWVIATQEAHFKLTEALWGLIPAMVIPYLIRKIGRQQAYAMALTCKGFSAEEARQMHLVDELTDTPEDAIASLSKRIGRIKEGTVIELKSYFDRFGGINSEIEYNAIQVINRLIAKPQVQVDIRNFVDRGKLPWQP